MIRVVHPGSRIRMLTFSHPGPRIPDPGVKKAPNPGSRIRIRNTASVVLFLKHFFAYYLLFNSVADPDPGSGIWCLFDPWIRDPGSGIGLFRIPDLRSRIPNSYF